MSRINTDIPELQGYDSGVSLENLRNLAKRQERLDEIRTAHLYELADAICRDCDSDKDTVESILLSLRSASILIELPSILILLSECWYIAEFVIYSTKIRIFTISPYLTRAYPRMPSDVSLI